MKPVDYRRETWLQVLGRVTGLREDIYRVLRNAGPATTRKLAALSGVDLLTVRPRVTELVDLGLAECVGGEHGEGIYQAVEPGEAAERYERRQRDAREGQMQLALGEQGRV
jgi:Mn-dependent DtxR family transcriptional regulator